MTFHAPAPAVPSLGFSPVLCDATLGQSRVVIGDDNASNVAVLERLLRSAGLQHLEGFTDGRLAVDRCLESPPDLLLLDLHMPGLDGFGVLDGLHAALPLGAFLPVLVLTADADAEVRQQALGAGAKDFVTKPFDPGEVVLRVRNLLETRHLYARLERRTIQLRAELDEQLARERRDAEELERRARRVDDVLAENRLSMVFQPIVSLVDGHLLGVEALARFHGEPSRPPDEWFAEAEAVGRGVELELNAAALALQQLEALPPGTYMSINASPRAAAVPGLAALVDGYPGDRIVLELTEHTQVEDYGALLAALEGPRSQGVRIAVDDTGAGYAGLQHLLRLQPNVLKLDLALTRSIDTDPARRALAAALVSFAGEIDAVLVAEGVESVSELRTLSALGVSAAQGYHLARPGPLSALPTAYGEAFAAVAG